MELPERSLDLSEPLSFWGGVDPLTGEIIDIHHPQRGENITGVILSMRSGRGSSSSPSVLAEALRLGHGPKAIVLEEADPMVWLGAFVAELLYGIKCPVTVRGPVSTDS